MLRITLSILFFTSVWYGCSAQLKEPEFVGEALLINRQDSLVPLDKEIGDFSSGVSWSANSWNALNLEVQRGKANLRIKPISNNIELIVKAVDNDTDPLSIIRIYKFKPKSKKRTVLISEDNSGTLMKSRTNSKSEVRFTGKKYGEKSYLLTLNNISPGEYGIVVSNPNAKDEKRVVVSCFGVDN